MREDRLLFRTVIGLGVALLVIIVLLVVVWTKLSSDEHVSCLIEQRGLPANRELVQVMENSYRLFTVRVTPAQRRRQIPPTPQQKQILSSLEKHLGRYVALESKQPRSRTC